MAIFTKQRNKSSVNKDLLLKIRKELEQKYHWPENGREFMSRDDALGILTRDHVRDLFKKLCWYKEDDRDVLYPAMGAIICTLITINFDDWDSFKTIFFPAEKGQHSPKFTDRDLPLQDVSCLPDRLRRSFERQQYVFFPVVFRKDTHHDHDPRLRLPILKSESIEGTGAQGDVDKVYIAKGFLQLGPKAHNSEVQVMARKRITTETRRGRQSFLTEKNNLDQFRQCLTDHKNIMQSFASFVQGPDFVILSDWAEGHDLKQFLYRPDLVLDDYPTRSMKFSPHNLLAEVYSLAEALDFLHSKMGNKQGVKYQCAHLDLKPENILVCFPGFANQADVPVGRWKITDFGLSNIEISVAGGKLVDTSPEVQNAAGLAPGRVLGELSLRPLRRGPGPFQPPEVRDAETAKVSTRRDVWSFGCILAMVLAFALGGPEEVAYQHQCRSRGADDYFYARKKRLPASNPFRDSSPAGVDAEVKPDIRSWLQDRAPSLAPTHSQWITHCAALVLTLLEVDVIKRPEINQAVADLQSLLTHTGHLAPNRIWDFDASILAPEVVSSIPDMHITADTDSINGTDPYVGIRTNSSPSSTPMASSPSRGTRSISTWLKSDPSTRFIRIQTLKSCTSASICPTGLSVVFWSETEVLIYDMAGISDEDSVWAETYRGVNSISDQTPLSTYHVVLPEGHRCERVILNGAYFAILAFARPSTYLVQLFVRTQAAQPQSMNFYQYLCQPLTSTPHELRLSAQGSCLVRLSYTLKLFTKQGSLVDIPIGDRDIMGFDFTGDGGAFCLWERDPVKQCHYWTVWDAGLKVLGGTVKYEYRRSQNQSQTLEAHLIPFRKYPRFIACDKHGNIFLICADLESDRGRRLGHTENIFASLMLPEDDSFLLIRSSEHSSKQKLQRINLTSMGNKSSFHPYECGVLPKNLEKGACGIAVRTYSGTEAALCVVTISPAGVLIRKMLY